MRRIAPREVVFYSLYLGQFLKLPSASSDENDIFARYYRNNFWSDPESLSGKGSSISTTARLREKLSSLLRERGVKSMLDIPCGDYNWMKLVQKPGLRYLGADVVKEMIEKNNQEYRNNFTKFSIIDITKGSLPKVDLILTRDCFVHFSYEAVVKAISEIKKSGSKYFLTTSYPDWSKNFDIKTGFWRPINLSLKPFNFPEPVLTILEESEGDWDVFKDKSLNLYRVGDLPAIID